MSPYLEMQLIAVKGSLLYTSDNAKRQIEVVGGWMGLKRSPFTLYCNNIYTFSRYREQRLMLS